MVNTLELHLLYTNHSNCLASPIYTWELVLTTKLDMFVNISFADKSFQLYFNQPNDSIQNNQGDSIALTECRGLAWLWWQWPDLGIMDLWPLEVLLRSLTSNDLIKGGGSSSRSPHCCCHLTGWCCQCHKVRWEVTNNTAMESWARDGCQL